MFMISWSSRTCPLYTLEQDAGCGSRLDRRNRTLYPDNPIAPSVATLLKFASPLSLAEDEVDGGGKTLREA